MLDLFRQSWALWVFVEICGDAGLAFGLTLKYLCGIHRLPIKTIGFGRIAGMASRHDVDGSMTAPFRKWNDMVKREAFRYFSAVGAMMFVFCLNGDPLGTRQVIDWRSIEARDTLAAFALCELWMLAAPLGNALAKFCSVGFDVRAAFFGLPLDPFGVGGLFHGTSLTRVFRQIFFVSIGPFAMCVGMCLLPLAQIFKVAFSSLFGRQFTFHTTYSTTPRARRQEENHP